MNRLTKALELMGLPPLDYQAELLNELCAPDVRAAMFSASRNAGKTTLAGGIGIAALVGELTMRPRRRRILVLGPTLHQAMLTYEAAEEAVRVSGANAETLPASGRIRWGEDGSELAIRAVGSRSLVGEPIDLAICDELAWWHPRQAAAAWRTLRTGTAKVDPPGRILATSTAAPDDSDVWAALRKAQEDPSNTRTRGRIYEAADPEADLLDLRAIRQATPHMGVLVQEDVVLDTIQEALGRPDEERIVRAHWHNRTTPSEETTSLPLVVAAAVAEMSARQAARIGLCHAALVPSGSSVVPSAGAAWWPETGHLETVALDGDGDVVTAAIAWLTWALALAPHVCGVSRQAAAASAALADQLKANTLRPAPSGEHETAAIDYIRGAGTTSLAVDAGAAAALAVSKVRLGRSGDRRLDWEGTPAHARPMAIAMLAAIADGLRGPSMPLMGRTFTSPVRTAFPS